MKKLPLAIAFAAGLAVSPTAFSQSIFFDFGPNLPNSGAAQINSPGHAVGAALATETRWNQVQVADVSSGLRYSDNTLATGVGINIGVESTSTSNIIDFSLQPTSTSQGTHPSYSTGIYNPADSPSRDFIFNSFNSEPWAIGVKVTGLPAGTYLIYVSGANTNAPEAPAMNFYAAGIAGGAATFDFGALSGASASNLSSGAASWTEGVNYAVLSVSITAGQDLALAASGTGVTNGGRGFLNSLQIVPIPEPGAYGAITGALALAGCVMVRRGKRA